MIHVGLLVFATFLYLIAQGGGSWQTFTFNESINGVISSEMLDYGLYKYCGGGFSGSPATFDAGCQLIDLNCAHYNLPGMTQVTSTPINFGSLIWCQKNVATLAFLVMAWVLSSAAAVALATEVSKKVAGGVALASSFCGMISMAIYASLAMNQSNPFVAPTPSNPKGIVQLGPNFTFGYCFGFCVAGWLCCLIAAILAFLGKGELRSSTTEMSQK
jgi:hypothetical protein